jgi:hypothetical protein
MNEDAETADGRYIVDSYGKRLRGTWPEWWGEAPSGLEERQAWIQRNILEGEERMNRGETVQGQRPRTGRQAIESLNRRRLKEVG